MAKTNPQPLRKKAPEGRLLCLYLILEGLARFTVEFVRINERVAFGLSEAQLISLVMITVGLATWLLTAARRVPFEAPGAVRA